MMRTVEVPLMVTTPEPSEEDAEICDGIDNDGDGEIDEGVTTTFFVDADGDGWGGDADRGVRALPGLGQHCGRLQRREC